MTRFQFTIAVCGVLAAYLILIFWKKPISQTGRFIRKVSLVNVASWIVILFPDSRGHPPPQLIYGFILWLVNSPLLIILAVAVWICFKGREENTVFISAAAVYVALNMVMLWVVPAIGLYLVR